jgi:hypothetical protein
MTANTTPFQPQLALTPKDARRAVRKERVREIVIYPSTDATDGVPAQLADVSTFGLGFIQANPMVVGAQFVLRLELEEDNVMPLLFRVAHCRPLGADSFRIGAQLIRVINGNETVEINANTDEGIEFGEAFVDVMAGDDAYRMPPIDDTYGWAILVDSQEFAELVAISEESDAQRKRVAA